MSLVAVAGSIGAAAVGDEDEIILDQVDGLLPYRLLHTTICFAIFLSPSVSYNDIFYIHTVFDLHAMSSQDILPTAGSCSRTGCIW